MTIQSFTLDNGMQVLLEENHAAKVVSFNALVKVGSAMETDAEAGISHVIEHMLFKGTPTRPEGTIARDIEAAGGEINAYTSIDQTCYYINMATRFAETGLSILADAICNPLFDAEELGREIEVILEEVRREQDNPNRMTTEHIFQTAYRKHTYGRPIIGYPKTITSFTRERLLDFYRRWYTPSNIVFIAVGDFKTEAMLELIRKEFAGLKGPAAPKTTIPAEPKQSGVRLVIKPSNIQSAYLGIAFHVPGITHQDVPAIDVLAHILGGADSSRLEQVIKRRRHLAHNIYAYALTPRDPGLFLIGGMLSDGDVPKAIDAITAEVHRICEESVSSEELSRAKLALRSSEIYDRETVGGQGSKIASFIATADDHTFEKRYYQMLRDVQIETVRTAAKTYLKPEAATLVLLVPHGSRWLKEKATIKTALTRKPAKAKGTCRKSNEAIQTLRLKNGATLIVQENHAHPIVAINAVVLGGTRFETPKTNGISALTARMLTKGTKTRSAVQISEAIERIAGDIDGFTGRNTIGLRSEFLSEHLRDGFALFADVLTHPSFAQAEVTKEKRLLTKAIRDQEDNLSSRSFAEFMKTLFPHHPYGLRSSGTAASVKGLKQADVARFHREVFRAKGLVLTVVGDVNAHEVETLANEMLADLPKGAPKKRAIKRDARPKKPRESVVIKRDKQQAHIVLGYQSTTFTSVDRYALTVLNTILSGQGGRLFVTLRDQMSLAYAVSSVLHEGIDPGFFAVYIGTDPAKVETAIAGITMQLDLVRDKRVTGEELARAKQYIAGTYELDRQRNMALANLYAFNTLYGIGLEEAEEYPKRIMAVTREDVQRVATKYITPESYTLAVIKPS